MKVFLFFDLCFSLLGLCLFSLALHDGPCVCFLLVSRSTLAFDLTTIAPSTTEPGTMIFKTHVALLFAIKIIVWLASLISRVDLYLVSLLFYKAFVAIEACIYIRLFHVANNISIFNKNLIITVFM